MLMMTPCHGYIWLLQPRSSGIRFCPCGRCRFYLALLLIVVVVLVVVVIVFIAISLFKLIYIIIWKHLLLF